MSFLRPSEADELSFSAPRSNWRSRLRSSAVGPGAAAADQQDSSPSPSLLSHCYGSGSDDDHEHDSQPSDLLPPPSPASQSRHGRRLPLRTSTSSDGRSLNFTVLGRPCVWDDPALSMRMAQEERRLTYFIPWLGQVCYLVDAFLPLLVVASAPFYIWFRWHRYFIRLLLLTVFAEGLSGGTS